MKNDVMNLESNFYRSLGNGKEALKYAADMIQSVVTSRDTTVLSRAIERAAKKGDDKAAASLRLVIRSVWPEAKTTKDKQGKVSIKIKGVEHDDKALETLSGLVSDGVSLRGTLLTKAFKKETETKEFDATAWAERVTKAHPDALEAMIAALQAKRNGHASH